MMTRFFTRLPAAVAAAGLILGLAGCGMKGPLRHPSPPPPADAALAAPPSVAPAAAPPSSHP
ncbi:MAG TPA: lipoprotein [Castellaniella sp.]|nr:lipoprotein [Castellaniella sp.]